MQLLQIPQDFLAQEVNEAGDDLGIGRPVAHGVDPATPPRERLGSRPPHGQLHSRRGPAPRKTHLRVAPFDVAQGALGELGQLGVAHRVHRRGSRLSGQRLHLCARRRA